MHTGKPSILYEGLKMLDKQQYHSFYDNLDFGICLIAADDAETILFVNTGTLKLYHCPDEESFFHLTGGTFQGMKADDEGKTPSLSVILGKVQDNSSFFYSFRTLEGHFRMAESFIHRTTLDGSPVYLLQILSSDKMAHVLKSDGLTGLLGRNDFYKAALELSDKNKQRHILSDFCPVYFNITNFREYNRSFGIHAGDRLLRRVSDALIDAFPGQLLGHLSADSFAAILERKGLTEQLESVCEKINSYINNRNILLKCGIVYTPESADRNWLLNSFDRAKVACLSIKNDVTRSCAIYNDDMGKQLENRLFVIQHIDDALDAGDIRVYYQPVVRTLSGKLCGFEALARWDDPERGLLGPDIFVPVLEESRLIDRLDAYIIQESGRMLHERLAGGLPVVPISVNLSKLDFDLMDPLAVLENIVEKYSIPRECFHVEITESVMVWQRQNLKRIIHDFHKAGYEVWLDDFGSDYSSLNTLHNYSFDELKIDMEFFRNFDDKSRKIITSIVTMAKSLGMYTLAEGVENKEQLQFLREIGCGKIQGYYFGRPLPYQETLSSCRGKNLSMETPDEHQMYNSADLVDVACTSPTALLHVTPGNLSLLTANRAYLRELSTVGTDNIKDANHNLNLPSSPLKFRYLSFLQKVYEGTASSMTYVDAGQYMQLNAEKISGRPDDWIARLSLTNIRPIREMTADQRMDNIFRNLILLYDGLYYLDMKHDQIEVLECVHPRIQPRQIFPDIRSSFRSYADELIHPEDNERFLSFISIDHLYLRAEQSGRSEATDLFRVKREDGAWRWTVFHALILPKSKSKDILLVEREDIWERHLSRSWLLPAFLESFGLTGLSTKTGEKHLDQNNLLFYESNANDAIMAGLEESDPSVGIQKTMSVIAENLGADRFLIFENSGSDAVSCTYEWHRRDLPPLKSRISTLANGDITALYMIFRNHQVAKISDYSTFLRDHPDFHLPIPDIRNIVSGQLKIAEQPAGFTMVINSSDKTFRTASLVLSTLTSFLSAMVRNRNTMIEVEEQGRRDPLTGALNRRGLDDFMSTYHGTGHLALFSADINNLKQTNDTNGHHAGDMLIRNTAEILINYSDRNHTFRMGGDEFLVIREDMDEKQAAEYLSEIKSVMRASGIDIAIGTYIHNGPVDNPDPLLGRADAAMYQNKARTHKGRNAADNRR